MMGYFVYKSSVHHIVIYDGEKIQAQKLFATLNWKHDFLFKDLFQKGESPQTIPVMYKLTILTLCFLFIWIWISKSGFASP